MKKRSYGAREDNFISIQNYFATRNNSDWRNAMKRYVVTALDVELTPRQKMCITEHYFYAISMTDIARRHNLSVSTVSFHIKQGIKKIKRHTVYMNLLKE